MVEYYVDGTDGVIERRQSRKGQYHVALDGGSASSPSAEVPALDDEGSDDAGATLNVAVYRPLVVNDDSGEAEDVFFSEAKIGQNREALNLFLQERLERGADTESSNPSRQSKRHHDVISTINDVPGAEEEKEKELLLEGYKESGHDRQRNAERGDLPNRVGGGRNLSLDLGNSSTLLQRIVKSVMENETVASYLERESRRGERRKRQILEYFIDRMTGKIDKRDTSSSHHGDRTGRRRLYATQEEEELARNDMRKQRGLRNIDDETGRSVENDSDDLEDVVQHRAQRDGSNNADDVSDDASYDVRRHNYVIGDDRAGADDEVGHFRKRSRAAYDDPRPGSYIQEEDFYYLEDESNLVKREAGQERNEKKHDDELLKDSVGEEEDVERSLRADPPPPPPPPLPPSIPPPLPPSLPPSPPSSSPSAEERVLLSKELVEIMIKEINDRLHGKPGNPDLQVRRPSSVSRQQVNDAKTEENPAVTPKAQNDSTSVVDSGKIPSAAGGGKWRKKRRISSFHELRRRSGQLEDGFEKMEAGRRIREEMVELSKRSSPNEDADEKADDLDMTKQIVAIVIEHAVRQLRNLASLDSSERQLPSAMDQADHNPLVLQGEGVQVAPPPSIPVHIPPETTPSVYWDVDSIPKTNIENSLLNSSEEYFADGFRFQRMTHPPSGGDLQSQSDNNGSLPRRRRQRRHRLAEQGKFVRSLDDDFSSSAAKSPAGQRVFDGVESAIFCRIISRLVEQDKLPRDSYENLVSNHTCFKYPAPYRIRRRRWKRRSLFRFPTPGPIPCEIINGHVECSDMTLPPVDIFTGRITDPRCEELTYMPTYPSAFNVYRGRVSMDTIPIDVIHDYGGYIWGGIGTGFKAPAEPPKRNRVWGVLFAFTLPFRLWGLRFVETPTTVDTVVSIAVYLQYSNDARKRWTALTEPGSTEPRIIPVFHLSVINFTDIHDVTGILIFLQEWRGNNPILPHPVFITCSDESNLESDDPTEYLPISRTSSWDTILKWIERDSKNFDSTPHKYVLSGKSLSKLS